MSQSIKQNIAQHHKTKYNNVLVYFFALTTPLFMLPQAYTIFSNHKAENVAILTWGFFLVADIVWIVYGLKNKLWPLVWCHVLYFIVESAIVIGILLYS